MDNDIVHEDLRDALRHIVKQLGGQETVGLDLWPGKTRKAAGTWLSDCLNPERAAKLDLEDVVAILRLGRARGIHCGIHHLCDELGYLRPAPVERQDAEAELARQADKRIEELHQLVARLERVRQFDDLKSIHAVKRSV